VRKEEIRCATADQRIDTGGRACITLPVVALRAGAPREREKWGARRGARGRRPEGCRSGYRGAPLGPGVCAGGAEERKRRERQLTTTPPRRAEGWSRGAEENGGGACRAVTGEKAFSEGGHDASGGCKSGEGGIWELTVRHCTQEPGPSGKPGSVIRSHARRLTRTVSCTRYARQSVGPQNQPIAALSRRRSKTSTSDTRRGNTSAEGTTGSSAWKELFR